MEPETFEEHIYCVVCLEVKTDANESTCCHQIFCGDCYQKLIEKPCPLCKNANFQITPSYALRRMISAIKKPCPFECGGRFTLEDIEKHKKNCSQRVYYCKIENCLFKGDKESFKTHIMELHESFLLENFQSEDPGRPADSSRRSLQLNVEKKNSNGQDAKRGTNAKFYCGKKLNGSCNCCDGNCGPSNGCNCRACMELDMQVRGLARGILVNREGFEAEYVNENFYCGRDSCNPRQKKQCKACTTLNQQKLTRYFGLV